MPSYHYQAMKLSDRSKSSGIINAQTEREARELLREQELIPTQLSLVTGSSRSQKKKFNPLQKILAPFMGVGSKELIAFTRNMRMMTRSGIPVTEALLYFENYVENPKLKGMVTQIRRDILSGYSFSQALAKHKKLFNHIYVSVVRAGESSGELEQTLERLTNLLVKSEALKSKIIAAAIYPMIVLGIVCIVMLIMFIVVIPTFEEIFQKLGVELPLITQVMIGISNTLRNFWFIAFPLLGFSLFGMYKYFTSAGGRIFLDGSVMRVPVLGELTKFVNNSHFISTFHVSFSAGLPITEAISLAAQTVQHTQLRAAFLKVNVNLQAGQRLGVALAQTGVVPDLVLLMLSTGEESGELETMLENSYDYLQEEIDQRVNVLTTLMEPILLVVLGVVVGTVALSIYLPLFSMYEHM